MKLKETTLDQRLFAGFLCLVVFGYGMMVIHALGGKFRHICHMSENPAHLESTVLSFYVILATIGAGLGVLHLLQLVKFKK